MQHDVNLVSSDYKSWLPVILLAILAISGGVVVVFATRWGVGTSPDSVYYLRAAQHISEGRGFSLPTAEGTDNPVTQWPPFYSWLLAVLSQTGIGVRSAARWLNALLTMMNMLLFGLMLYPFIKRRSSTVILILLASLLMLASPTFLNIHLMAWSEPLIIFLGMSGIWLLGWYLDTNTLPALLVSTLLVGLAFLTRFAGAALVATGMVGLLLFSGLRWRRRISDTLIFGLGSSLPILVWLAANLHTEGEATSREFIFHLIRYAQIAGSLNTLSSWLLVSQNAPAFVKVGAIMCGLLVLGAIYFGGIRQRKELFQRESNQGLRGIPAFVKLFTIFIPVYAIFLVVSISFFDANTPLDQRILSPVFTIGLVLIFWLLLLWWQSYSTSKMLKILLGIVCGIFCLGYLMQSIGTVSSAYQEGIGYNNRVWYNSATLAEVKRLPQGVLLYTNAPEGILFHTGNAVNELPKKFFSSDQKTNENYLTEVDEMEDAISDHGGYIVYFDWLIRPTMPSEEELNEVLALRVVYKLVDGSIFTTAQAK